MTTERRWVLIFEGEVVARFETAQEAYDATYTGDYPDEVDVTYEGNWETAK